MELNEILINYSSISIDVSPSNSTRSAFSKRVPVEDSFNMKVPDVALTIG